MCSRGIGRCNIHVTEFLLLIDSSLTNCEGCAMALWIAVQSQVLIIVYRLVRIGIGFDPKDRISQIIEI